MLQEPCCQPWVSLLCGPPKALELPSKRILPPPPSPAPPPTKFSMLQDPCCRPWARWLCGPPEALRAWKCTSPERPSRRNLTPPFPRSSAQPVSQCCRTPVAGPGWVYWVDHLRLLSGPLKKNLTPPPPRSSTQNGQKVLMFQDPCCQP
jgi:hypothetical protein